MLSGNRNFEARVHPEVKANYLASPPLVVAYALAGRMDVDIVTEPLGHDANGGPVVPLRALAVARRGAHDHRGRDRARDVRAHLRRRLRGGPEWRELPVPEGSLFAWEDTSTYVRQPPYFGGMEREAGTVEDVVGARCLVSLGDSVTTDHISPAGSIKPDSPPGGTSSSTASSGPTSTRTARGAGTTR